VRVRALLLIQLLALAACAEGFEAPTGGGNGPGSGGSPATDGGNGGAGEGAGPQGGTPSQGGEGGSPPACEGDPCKLVSPQCGCDAGDKCTINGTTIACGADGTEAIGAACGASDCSAGGLCLGDAGGGYCAQFCDEDAECGGALVCGVGLNDGSGGTIPDVALCSSNCDPATVAGCPAGLGCVLGREADGLERFFFMCFPAGTGVDGAACTSAASCAPGYGCYNNGTADVCLKNCNVNTPACTGIQTCYALNDENQLPVNVNGYPMGACQ
jgi:hypothetical protein